MVTSFRFPGVPFKECNVLVRNGNAEYQRIINRPFPKWLYNLSNPSKIRNINSFDGLQTTIISQLPIYLKQLARHWWVLSTYLNINWGCLCVHRHRYGWSGLFQIFDQIPHLGIEPRTSRTLSANSTTGPLASADGDIYLNIILQRYDCIEVSVKAQTGILHVYSLLWLNGLVVWFSLWVREAPGSNPGWAQLYLYFLVSLIGLDFKS